MPAMTIERTPRPPRRCHELRATPSAVVPAERLKRVYARLRCALAREPGRMTTGHEIWRNPPLSRGQARGLWSWVPAFAGTTCECVATVLRPPLELRRTWCKASSPDEPTGRREAPPDDRLHEIRDRYPVTKFERRCGTKPGR